MSNKKLYSAMGKIDDNIIKKALESIAVDEKKYRLCGISGAVACAAIVCGFDSLALALRSKRNRL